MGRLTMARAQHSAVNESRTGNAIEAGRRARKYRWRRDRLAAPHNAGLFDEFKDVLIEID
jgi:hypothetical protein